MSFLSLSRPEALLAHIYSHCVTDLETGCMIWQRGTSTQGRYGILWVDDKPQLIHRLVYLLTIGELPDGDLDHAGDSLEIHHQCEVRTCCNPRHLVRLTRAEHNAIHRAARILAQDAYLPWAVSLARGGFDTDRIRAITKLPAHLVREVVRAAAA